MPLPFTNDTEVDTIGRNAVDRFNLTYHGEPLSGETRLGALRHVVPPPLQPAPPPALLPPPPALLLLRPPGWAGLPTCLPALTLL